MPCGARSLRPCRSPQHGLNLMPAVERQSRAAELQDVARQYPLPAMDTLTLRYEHTARGRVKIHKVIKSKDEEASVPIATPLGVPARLRFVDQCDAYGLRCVVQGMDGQPQIIDFNRAALPKM